MPCSAHEATDNHSSGRPWDARARRLSITGMGVSVVRVLGRVLLPVVVLLFTAGAVLAQDNQDSVPRLYLSASGALVMPADVHADFHDASGSPNGGMDGAFDRGPGLVLVMGYGQKWGVRGELEIGCRTFAIDRISNFRLGGVADPGPYRAIGDVTPYSVMGNVVSSLDLGPLNLYVGGGIGMARVDAGMRSIARVSFDEADGRDSVFAWQLFTGLQYHLSQDFSASLGYRYFATEDARFGSTSAPIEAHNVEVGITHWLD